MIGTSGNWYSGYSCGQRLKARDSKDDLYVVYPDTAANTAVIRFVRRTGRREAKVWSAPVTAAAGICPSLAISRDDRVYLVYTGSQGGRAFYQSLSSGAG